MVLGEFNETEFEESKTTNKMNQKITYTQLTILWLARVKHYILRA